MVAVGRIDNVFEYLLTFNVNPVCCVKPLPLEVGDVISDWRGSSHWYALPILASASTFVHASFSYRAG